MGTAHLTILFIYLSVKFIVCPSHHRVTIQVIVEDLWIQEIKPYKRQLQIEKLSLSVILASPLPGNTFFPLTSFSEKK